ncbi:MAG: PDZ domain-containing protein [Gammaproteobacteria bacterium]|nr:PDZ domain-containing protein [Gammaproteobacteria bacterium]
MKSSFARFGLLSCGLILALFGGGLMANNAEQANAVAPQPGHLGTQMENIAPPDSGIFMARNIALYEGHWQGMDVMLLDAELRQKLKYPMGLRGVIVNEVTLNAALSGILGGDVIISIDGNPVIDLESFKRETYNMRLRNHAPIKVLRKSDSKNGDRYIMNQMVYVLRANGELGFAQMESAPMIMPGEPRPHPDRGPCTQCHSIGDGRFTMPDPDLITLPPPKIKAQDVDLNRSPHGDRGPCLACHQLLP